MRVQELMSFAVFRNADFFNLFMLPKTKSSKFDQILQAKVKLRKYLKKECYSEHCQQLWQVFCGTTINFQFIANIVPDISF